MGLLVSPGKAWRQMQELIEYVAKSLVDDPTQVEVEQHLERGRIRFELIVADEDKGRVIGRGGRVANAIRALLRVSATQHGTRATLDIP